MNYEKMWNILKNNIQADLYCLSDPHMELDAAVSFRITGEKTVLNTMLKMEREQEDDNI